MKKIYFAIAVLFVVLFFFGVFPIPFVNVTSASYSNGVLTISGVKSEKCIARILGHKSIRPNRFDVSARPSNCFGKQNTSAPFTKSTRMAIPSGVKAYVNNVYFFTTP